LKIVDNMDIAINLLGNVMMNKIMGVSTINEDDGLHVLNVFNELEGLWSIEASKGMQRNQWFNFWWIREWSRSIVWGRYSTGEASTSWSEKSS
jgi:hypothetical protein